MSKPMPEKIVDVGRKSCDLCGKPAVVDAPTVVGPWAYLCGPHYEAFATGGAHRVGTRLATYV